MEGVGTVLLRSRGLFFGVGVFSGAINLLALTGALYMMQVYDRVLPARSLPTLVVLTGLMAALFFANGILDMLRLRIMGRIGLRVDETLRAPVLDAMQSAALTAKTEGDGLQPVRDLDRVRSFLAGAGPAALFDLPWIPVYLIVIFLFHPMMGWFAVAGAVVLVAITILTDVLSSSPTLRAARSGNLRLGVASESARNSEVVRAMGLAPHLRKRWQAVSDDHMADQLKSGDALGGMGVASRVIRLLLQSGILGLGAYLFIRGEVSGGTIIAASIVMSRALAPVESAIQHWRGFVEARQATRRLRAMFQSLAAGSRQPMMLPAPVHSLDVENLSIAPPGQEKPVVQNVSFRVRAGEALGIIGPSGSGKSVLSRALVGAWQPVPGEGAVRLDGASLAQWDVDLLGRHIGYLPQDVQLFDGTIAENIARMDASAAEEAIVLAAQDAGAHAMIVGLPHGYRTRIHADGKGLSAGQRQRVGLARALYGRPFLVVLDEPNSNLDSAGDAELAAAIRRVRDRGGIVVAVAHRPAALANIDTVMVMANGRVHAIGPKDEILQRFASPAPAPVRSVVMAVPDAPSVSPLRRAVQAAEPRSEVKSS